jgi:outer membrane receptor protein involved in Fe transport
MSTPVRVLAGLFVVLLSALPARAQTTAGAIAGRVTDAQGLAVPGVAVKATSADTGFVRDSFTDEAGNYRLAALPVGDYTVDAQVEGFRPFQVHVTVNVATTAPVDVALTVARNETVVVSAQAPLVSARTSGVSGVVDVTQIESLPLISRQFANLAALVPGVGLGFHSDSAKSAQYSPQISGGNGRNVNYVIDGGDNNDDTVGGLLQLFPLESIQEFSVLTHRFDAEYGRSNGAVLNVVTKSGTNTLQGSWFTLVRDEALNAKSFRETFSNTDKQPYQRVQFGGSVGGPLKVNRAHFFAAFERTQQDTKQVVDTLGLFPSENGIYDVPFRQNLFTGKVTAQPNPSHYLSVRYASDRNSQPNGAAANNAHSTWATGFNTFDSVNVNHNWVVGRSLNEVVLQYSGFVNDVPATSTDPVYRFASGTVNGGGNLTAPQRIEQTKWQLRDDYSRTFAGFGLSHEFGAGASWIHEPRLFIRSAQGQFGMYSIATVDANGPVTNVTVIGGNPEYNLPIEQYGVYAQDNWRVTDRLTLNLGVRWDYIDGILLDQSKSTNFIAMQAAGLTGRFAGTLLEDFGQEPRSDKDNVQPRLGAAFDLRGDGKDIVRGGWGIYTDFGYVASNILTAAFDAVGAGPTFSVTNAQGIRKADGTLFRYTDPISAIQELNAIPAGVTPPAGEVASPLLEQPYSRQANAGWSHEINASTAITVDWVRVDGRDLNLRLRPNAFIGPGQRLLAGIPISPASQMFRTAVSKGRSRYDGLILGLRRRLSNGLDLTASYTLSESVSDVGSAADEIAANLLQDVRNPFAEVQMAPSSRTDSRHQISVSTIVRAPWDINVASIVLYRSALPVHTFAGDVNGDGVSNDITPVAYRFTGVSDAGIATWEENGPCGTVNCSRRAGFSQVNLRVSRGFRIASTRIEAIAEVFNVFNAKNPILNLTQNAALTPASVRTQFMQPSAYAGDVGQPEQRVGQVGFRFTF